MLPKLLEFRISTQQASDHGCRFKSDHLKDVPLTVHFPPCVSMSQQTQRGELGPAGQIRQTPLFPEPALYTSAQSRGWNMMDSTNEENNADSTRRTWKNPRQIQIHFTKMIFYNDNIVIDNELEAKDVIQTLVRGFECDCMNSFSYLHCLDRWLLCCMFLQLRYDYVNATVQIQFIQPSLQQVS